MRANIERLRLGMTAEIDSRQRSRRTLLFAQQKRNRGSTRGIAFEGFGDGAPQSNSSIFVKQFQ